VGEGSCRKHIPEESHREILEDGTGPDGRKLSDRGSSHDDIEEDGSAKAHGRTHDRNRACLTHDPAETGIVF